MGVALVLAVGTSAALAVPSAAHSTPLGVGISVEGSPPNYVANCPGGTYFARLPVPGTTGGNSSGSNNTSGGPFLHVTGASSPGANGVYTIAADPSGSTHQHYTKGTFTLLWEPGPQVVLGHRWVLFGGPNASTRESPLYFKYNADGSLGWRGSRSFGVWSVGIGAAPAPLVDSTQPEQVLYVSGTGDAGVAGAYTRVADALYPANYKVYVKDDYLLLWEPGPQITRGLRWVLVDSSDLVRGASRDQPHYFRLSPDGEHGYEGTWAIGRGVHPPPRVTLVQTITCLRCPPGSYSQSGAEFCIRCLAGFYSLGAADHCTACESGTSTDGTKQTVSSRKTPVCGDPYIAAGRGACTKVGPGATSCNVCSQGRYSAHAAAICEPCPPGTCTGASGSGECSNCGAGTWSGLAASACELCPAGRFGISNGTTSPLDCIQCSLGRFSAAGSTGCSDCSAGRYAAVVGMSACAECPAGSSSATGASICDLCPPRSDAMPGQASCQLPL